MLLWIKALLIVLGVLPMPTMETGSAVAQATVGHAVR